MAAYLSELFSDDKNYCARFYGVPTPEDEPLRLTFKVYEIYQDTWRTVFELPENLYFIDGIDQFFWGYGSTVIAFSANHSKTIHIYDFIYQVQASQNLPENLLKYYWDNYNLSWIIKSKNRIEKLSLRYFSKSFIPKQWGTMTLGLERLYSNVNNLPPFYKVVFFNSEVYVAELKDFFIYNPSLVTIEENGVIHFHACDSTRTELRQISCDLKTFGTGDRFQCHVDDGSNRTMDLPVSPMKRTQNPYFSVYQDFYGLGESGLIEYTPIEFINTTTGKVQYTYDRIIKDDVLWNKGLDKCYFNGYLNDFPEEDPVFVVLDVKGKKCINEYHGHAVNPRWNADESDALFDNNMELWETVRERRKQERLRQEEERRKAQEKKREKEKEQQKAYPLGPEYHRLVSPDGYHSVYLKRKERKDCYEPSLYDVSLIDNKTGCTIVSDFMHPVDGPEAIKQLANGTITFFTHDYLILSFKLRDLYGNSSLQVSVRAIPVQPSEYVWQTDTANPDNGEWQAIVDGVPFVPQLVLQERIKPTDSFKCPILHFRTKVMHVFGDVNFDTSTLFEVRQETIGFDRFGMPTSSNLEFIDRATQQVHYSIGFKMDKYFEENDPVTYPVYQSWNKDGSKFFFSGHALPAYEFIDSRLQDNHFGRLIVVVDVENKEITEIYKFSAHSHPHWSSDGTTLLFSETPEKHEECLEKAKAGLLNPTVQKTHLHEDSVLNVRTLDDPNHPGQLQVVVMDVTYNRVLARVPNYPVASKFQIKQKGSIVCYPSTTSTTCIIRFDMDDVLSNQELIIDVWDLHKPVASFSWDESAARLWPIINGEIIHPGAFHYDDQFMVSTPIENQETPERLEEYLKEVKADVPNPTPSETSLWNYIKTAITQLFGKKQTPTTQVQDNPIKQARDNPIKRIQDDSIIGVRAIEDPRFPGKLQVVIMDVTYNRVIVKIPKYHVDSKFQLRQRGSFVCYPSTAQSTRIISFDMEDILSSTALRLNIWDLHKTVTRFSWDQTTGCLAPIIDGLAIFHPGRFYYDDVYKESIPIK